MGEASKRFMSISIWVTVILFALRCGIDWEKISVIVSRHDIAECGYSVYGYAGEAIGAATLFMICLNKWGWKWKSFHWLTGGMPILSKKYKGTITFIWDGKEQKRESEISIEQTFLAVTVKLGSSESSSNTVTATIETINSEKQLIYTYLNTPRAELQNRSSIHYGTAMLRIDNPERITGNYYTSRLSRGSMDFEAVNNG